MWWIPIATAAINAVSAGRKNEAVKQYNKGQAEISRYSPWTGMSGSLMQDGPSSLEAGAGGFIQGMGIAQGMGQGQQTPQTQGTGFGGSSYGTNAGAFGGSGYSDQLGAQSDVFDSTMQQRQPSLFARR